MLNAGCYTVFLYTLYIWSHHLACKVWVLAHILEVTSVKRSTADIDTRAKKNILLAVTGLLTDTASVKESHLLIPCCRKVYKSRECCT